MKNQSAAADGATRRRRRRHRPNGGGGGGDATNGTAASNAAVAAAATATATAASGAVTFQRGCLVRGPSPSDTCAAHTPLTTTTTTTPHTSHSTAMGTNRQTTTTTTTTSPGTPARLGANEKQTTGITTTTSVNQRQPPRAARPPESGWSRGFLLAASSSSSSSSPHTRSVSRPLITTDAAADGGSSARDDSPLYHPAPRPVGQSSRSIQTSTELLHLEWDDSDCAAAAAASATKPVAAFVQLTQSNRSHSKGTTSESMAPAMVLGDERNDRTRESFSALGQPTGYPLISVLDDNDDDLDATTVISNSSIQNQDHNVTNETNQQKPLTGPRSLPAITQADATWMTEVVERPTRQQEQSESCSITINEDDRVDTDTVKSRLESVESDSTTMARHAVSITLRHLRQTKRSYWTRVAAAQSHLNLKTTTTLVPETSDMIPVVQWEAILDAILVVAARETGCRGGGSGKQQAPFAQPEFWLGRCMLRHWLVTHGSKTGDESTDAFWSRILCLPLDNSSTLARDTIVATSTCANRNVALRHRQLAVMNLLYAWLCTGIYCTETHTASGAPRRDVISTGQLVSLVVHVLPRLVRLGVIELEINEVEQQPKRQQTVLEQRILAVTYLIVILASKTIATPQTSATPENSNTEGSTLSSQFAVLLDSLTKHAASFHSLLQAQQVWLSRIDSHDGDSLSNWGNHSKSDVRRLCHAAVIMDWIDVYTECCQVHELELSDSSGIRRWCSCIDGRSTVEAAGFAYTVAAVGVELTKNDILVMLASFDPIKSDNSRPVSLDSARTFLRCLVAWISHRAKHLKSLELKDVDRISLWIFSSIFLTYPSLSMMAVVVLKSLWSLSYGIPRDVSSPFSGKENGHSISTSFRAIFDTLDSLRMDSVDGTTQLYLVEVATRCALIGGPVYEQFLVSMVPTNQLAVDILIGMARLFVLSPSGENKACCGRIIHDVICQVLLQSFTSCLYIRAALRENVAIFKYCSVEVITLPILRLLSGPKNLDVDLEDMETIVSILVGCMNRHVRSDQSASLHFFFAAMVEASQPDQTSWQCLCTLVGQSWRRSLLSEVEESDICFARAFVLISQELLRSPTDVMPISLLKIIAGHSLDKGVPAVDSIPTVPLVHAVTGVLQLTYKAMTAKSDCLLTRLAPLLILRCLPSDFFRRTIHEADEPPTLLLQLVSSVGGQLALRLSISDVEHGTHGPFSREEKCLAAEIACCLIPLCSRGLGDERSGVSCYDIFFYDAFKKLQESFVLPEITEQLLTIRIKAAISAVCVVSNALQRAYWLDHGESLRFITSTLLQITSSEWNIIHQGAQDAWRDLEERIVEFWASSKFRLIRCEREESMRSTVEHAVMNQSEKLKLPRKIIYSVCDGVRDVWELVQSVLETGAPPLEWIHITITPPIRLAFWRSFLLVCQRCNATELADIARTSLPWIVSFLEKEYAASFPTHELITAAAMQVLFVMVTRTRTMEYFGPCGKSRERTIYVLFQFITEALKRIVGGRSYQYPFRYAALTLFLSVLLVDSDGTAAHFTQYSNISEVSTMLGLVRQLSVTDIDDQIQMVSNRILDIFQHLESCAVIVNASSLPPSTTTSYS